MFHSLTLHSGGLLLALSIGSHISQAIGHIIYRTFIVYYATYFCGKFYLNFSHVEFYFIIFFNFRCNKLQKLWAISLSLLSLIYVAKMLDIFMCTHFLIPFFFFFIFVNNIFRFFNGFTHTASTFAH